eukprot:6289111-Pyramimonas_sp.AAC.1
MKPSGHPPAGRTPRGSAPPADTNRTRPYSLNGDRELYVETCTNRGVHMVRGRSERPRGRPHVWHCELVKCKGLM